MTIHALGDLRPRLPEGFFFVADTATVLGNVVLEDDVGIWFGAVLRGDNDRIHIGRGTNIQDNCVLHVDSGFPMHIGPDVTVGHRAMLHGCTVGEGSLIGMGATVLNGAKIGRNCLIGACALITEGKEIPDNSLVIGAPGKVVREVDEATLAAQLRNTRNYVLNAKRFAAELRPL